MLAAGHRCVHLERHTLLLIGGVGGFLCAVTESVITDTAFPEIGQRGLALLAWLTFWLGGMAWLEHLLTRRARHQRQETLPFVQTQVTRAWWMLLTLGVLGSFAMVFHGGGGMIYALWTVLLGLGIYLFGLFSRALVEWFGLATLLLGVMGLSAGLSYGETRHLAAACFAIGMPLAGWLNVRYGDAPLGRRLLALAVWLALVVMPPLWVERLQPTPAPESDQVLRLPAGAIVPLKVDLDSSALAVASTASLDMRLLQAVEIALQAGQPEGRYRIGDGQWHSIRDGVLNLRIDRITPRLSASGPEVRVHAEFLVPSGELP